MNDKDKESFNEWWQNMYDSYVEFRDWQGCDIVFDKKEDMRIGFQAACEYKQKEIDELEKEKDYLCNKMENMRGIYKDSEKLQAENAELRKCIKQYADLFDKELALRIAASQLLHRLEKHED